ncbi:MAG: ChbG/HpnK family deacetylase [Lautropia sp.]
MTRPAPRRICIGVDDFARHDGIDDAAMQLVALGRVQSIGCMVGADRWPAAARRLAPVAAGASLDVGLHLDLTELPLDTGLRRDHAALLVASYTGRLARRRLRAEIDAQIDRFGEAFGRAPDFVDGHQHVHQLPAVRDALVEALGIRGGDSRPWLRATRRPPGSGGPLRERAKAAAIEWLGGRRLAALARDAGFAQNRGLLGVYGFDTDASGYLARLARWFELARDGDQLMCHPATHAAADDPIRAARVAEFEALAAPEVESLLARASISLQPISAILAGTAPDR